MVEECGRIVAIDADAVWVETAAASGCGRCQEAGGCGQNSIFRMLGDRRRQLKVASRGMSASVGDAAVVGVPAGALVRASLVAYLVPLLGLLAGALLAVTVAGGSDLVAIIGGLIGFSAGFGASHLVSVRYAARIGLMPALLSVGKTELAQPAGSASPSA